MAKYSYKQIRRAAFKHLHLIFVKENKMNATYMVVDSEEEGTPKIVDYISFHYKTSRMRVKDIGSNIVYIVDVDRYRSSRIEILLNMNPVLEQKIRSWYPFLWGEGTAEDETTYFSILRQIEGLLDLEEPFFDKDHHRMKKDI